MGCGIDVPHGHHGWHWLGVALFPTEEAVHPHLFLAEKLPCPSSACQPHAICKADGTHTLLNGSWPAPYAMLSYLAITMGQP